MAKSHVDEVTKAEVLWALKVVEDDSSFASFDDMQCLFRSMFPDSKIAQEYRCGTTKVRYLVTYGLAPYFEELLLKDIKTSQYGYTLHYDETKTSQTKKQMDLVIRYWSTDRKRVVVHYFGSIFFGHVQALTVSSSLLDYISNKSLPLNMLLSLSSDGPNVNRAIEAQMNKLLPNASYRRWFT